MYLLPSNTEVFQKMRKKLLALSRPSVSMEQLRSHWADFHEALYLIFFEKKACRENSGFMKI